MQMKHLMVTAALSGLLSLGCAATSAEASILRFTATSAASGVLGYLDYDSSVFDGTSFQFVANTNLLDLKFVDPISSAVVTTIGPPGDSTIFDSTGALPTVVGGSGFTGGTNFADGVWIAGTSYVALTNDTFNDVSWTTGPAVPEPATWALMLTGFGLAGLALRSRRRLALAA